MFYLMSANTSNSAVAKNIKYKKNYPKSGGDLLRYLVFRLTHPAQFVWSANSAKYKQVFAASAAFYNEKYQDTIKVERYRYDIDDAAGSVLVDKIDRDTKLVNNESNHRVFAAQIFTNNGGPDLYNPLNTHVIYASSNGDCHELHTAQILDDVNKSSVVGIAFNPMGVGSSPGHSRGPEDIEAALEAIVDDLVSNGVPLKNIVLKGRSLGAAIATKVAAKTEYQKPGNGISVFNDRSFKTLSGAAASFVSDNIPVFKRAVHTFISRLFKRLDLEIDALTEFNKINVQNPGNAVAVVLNEEDSVLRDAAITNHSLNNKNCIVCSAPGADNHNAWFNQLQIKEVYDENGTLSNYDNGQSVSEHVQDLLQGIPRKNLPAKKNGLFTKFANNIKLHFIKKSAAEEAPQNVQPENKSTDDKTTDNKDSRLLRP